MSMIEYGQSINDPKAIHEARIEDLGKHVDYFNLGINSATDQRDINRLIPRLIEAEAQLDIAIEEANGYNSVNGFRRIKVQNAEDPRSDSK